jgi:hypothetical protein
MHRTRAIVAGLFLTGTAACTQSPPAPTPAPTSSYVTTTSATPTGATTSSAADESSALVAATELYFSELSKALHSRNTSVFRTTFLTLCIECVEDAGKIDAMAKNGQTVEGGDIQVTNARVTSILEMDANVEAVLVADEAILRDATQKIIDNFPAGKDPRNVALKKVDGRWLVQAFLG